LRTYNLIFPLSDLPSRKVLKRSLSEVSSEQTDQFLDLSSMPDTHEWPEESHPEDLVGLYEQYPFWGRRLESLLRGVDNPKPTTAFEKWADSHKSRWWDTWWGMLGIGIALTVGLLSLVLASLQVWLTYCSWIDDVRAPGCGLKAKYHPAVEAAAEGAVSRRYILRR
jgi:hypothetical protein